MAWRMRIVRIVRIVLVDPVHVLDLHIIDSVILSMLCVWYGYMAIEVDGLDVSVYADWKRIGAFLQSDDG